MIRETFKYGLQFGQSHSVTDLRLQCVCVCAHVVCGCVGVVYGCVCSVSVCYKVSGMVSNGCHPLKLHSDPLAFWELTSCAKSDHPKT